MYKIKLSLYACECQRSATQRSSATVVAAPSAGLRMHPSEMNDALLAICRTDEVPVGGVIQVEANGLVVAVLNFPAFSVPSFIPNR